MRYYVLSCLVHSLIVRIDFVDVRHGKIGVGKRLPCSQGGEGPPEEVDNVVWMVHPRGGRDLRL